MGIGGEQEWLIMKVCIYHSVMRLQDPMNIFIILVSFLIFASHVIIDEELGGGMIVM